MANEVVGPVVAEIKLGGSTVINGFSWRHENAHNIGEARATFGSDGFKAATPGTAAESGSFSALYGAGGAGYTALLNAARASQAGTSYELIEYPEGTGAGKPTITTQVLLSGPSLSADASGVDMQMDCNWKATAESVFAPNLALSVTDFGSTGQGDASAYTAPTASGGTSTYTITAEDENGDASALPYGITWTGSAFTGTVNASAPIGIYRVKMKVVDSAAAPVTQYFLCTMEVVA